MILTDFGIIIHNRFTKYVTTIPNVYVYIMLQNNFTFLPADTKVTAIFVDGVKS